MRTFDLDNPKDAREYLRCVRIRGRKITYIKTNMRRYDFNKCSDEEICQAAVLVYEQLHVYQERVDKGLQS